MRINENADYRSCLIPADVVLMSAQIVTVVTDNNSYNFLTKRKKCKFFHPTTPQTYRSYIILNIKNDSNHIIRSCTFRTRAFCHTVHRFLCIWCIILAPKKFPCFNLHFTYFVNKYLVLDEYLH